MAEERACSLFWPLDVVGYYARQGKSDVLTIATGGARNLIPGGRMLAHFDPSSVLLFDTDGTRIR